MLSHRSVCLLPEITLNQFVLLITESEMIYNFINFLSNLCALLFDNPVYQILALQFRLVPSLRNQLHAVATLLQI